MIRKGALSQFDSANSTVLVRYVQLHQDLRFVQSWIGTEFQFVDSASMAREESGSVPLVAREGMYSATRTYRKPALSSRDGLSLDRRQTGILRNCCHIFWIAVGIT